MKKFIFFSLFCIWAYGQIPQLVPDSNETTKKISEENLVQTKTTKPDTVYILKDVNENPWYKNFEVFLGALLSGLIGAGIAIYSVKKTDKSNKELENEKYQKTLHSNRSRYCGNLYSIFSELITHTQIHKQKLTEINLIIDKLLEIKDVAADEPFTPFPVDFLKESRGIMLNFGDYRSSVLAFLSAYINKTVDINNFLNLTKVRKSKAFFNSEDEYVAGVKDYFDEVLKHLKGFKFGRQELLEDIWDDMNRFEQFSNFRENTEQMIDLISTYEITDQTIEKLKEKGVKEKDV